jgi:hypothetical protein
VCGEVNREGKGLGIRLMYFVYMYENRTMKPIDVVLKKRGGANERK